MRKRIYKNMVILTAGMLLIFGLSMLAVYYHYFSKQLEMQVVQEGNCIVHAIDFMDEQDICAYLGSLESEKTLRLTLIENDGRVVFDNTKDAGQLDNHLNRPEVKDALENGSGQSVRYSDTYDILTYYYAVKLDNSQVLRIAYSTNNVLKLFSGALPLILICMVVCFVSSFFVARNMTQKIIQPINSMDLQHPMTGHIYDELRPLLLRIKRQNEERSKNEKMRQEFSANVSHELKTPLTSISGYAELLGSGIVREEDVTNFANKIYNEAGRMGNLVNDIIKISKLDEHKIGIEKEPVDLLKVALDVTERLDLISVKNKVQVQVTGESFSIMAVSQMVDEILYNLCENAIKYNVPGGKVTVNITEQNGRGRIEVRDTGIGIPEECQERIFERFFRVDKSHSRQTGGTGLGLAIVKHIVEYHDGEIHLKSKLGKGTTIVVLL